MAYPFKPIEHRVYRNTFLKDVRIAVDFDSKAVTLDEIRLQEYFARFSGADIKVKDFLNQKKITVFSRDHLIEFYLSLDYAEAKICAPTYSSFKAASDYWSYLIDYSIALGLTTVNHLLVRKYNALYFKSRKPKYDMRDIMSGLFCDDLMSLIPQHLGEDGSLNSYEKTWCRSDENSETECTIVFGIKKEDSTEKPDHLTLVTSVKSLGLPISIAEVMGKAEVYNQILFDAFHWCVKKEIINRML